MALKAPGLIDFQHQVEVLKTVDFMNAVCILYLGTDKYLFLFKKQRHPKKIP